MAGNQNRGLIAASKTRGWDPTVIPERDGIPAESIANFDKDQGNLASYPLGQLPGGPKVFCYPDDYSHPPVAGGKDTAASVPAPTFATPDYSRENKDRRTTGADPFSGMGGTEF